MSDHNVRPASLSEAPNTTDAFTQEQLSCLEDEAVLLPHPQSSKKRTVSAAFTPPQTRTASSSSTSSSASINTRNFQSNQVQTLDVPMAEESSEVLECIGFKPQTAKEIYDRYCTRPNPCQNPDDLMAYVSGQLAPLRHAGHDGIDDQQSLEQVGLNREVQEAITDPTFKHIYGTETLHYWANNTVEVNYSVLLGRQSLLRRHANERLAHKKPRKQAKHGASLGPGHTEQQQPISTATVNRTSQDFHFPEAHVALRGDVVILDDHVSLFKGKAHADLLDIDVIRDDGSVNLTAFGTRAGGDFNWNANAQNWTPERETAEEYRRYAARRSPTAETSVVHIQVPWAFINGLRREDLWFSKDWKEYVWTSRKQQLPKPKFDHLWQRADLVTGHICSSPSRQVMRIPPDQVQSRITEDCVMRLPNGRKASQWTFLQVAAIIQLADLVRGKVHFDLFEAKAYAASG